MAGRDDGPAKGIVARGGQHQVAHAVLRSEPVGAGRGQLGGVAERHHALVDVLVAGEDPVHHAIEKLRDAPGVLHTGEEAIARVVGGMVPCGEDPAPGAVRHVAQCRKLGLQPGVLGAGRGCERVGQFGGEGEHGGGPVGDAKDCVQPRGGGRVEVVQEPGEVGAALYVGSVVVSDGGDLGDAGEQLSRIVVSLQGMSPAVRRKSASL